MKCPNDSLVASRCAAWSCSEMLGNEQERLERGSGVETAMRAAGGVSLDSVFAPRSVAVVGASDDVARIGGRVLRHLLSGGFKGRVYPINPRRGQVQGLAAYPSVAALPDVPDVALVVVPSESVLDAVTECAQRGVKAAVVLSSGFAESGAEGALIQAELIAVARASGMRLIGPNCLGVFNPRAGFFGTFANALDRGYPVPGPVGVVAQSGAYGAHAAALAMRRGVGIGAWLTTGNEADVSVADGIAWMAANPDIEVVLAYLEGVSDGPGFLASLRLARATGTAVVLMKVGSSSSGAQAVASHTASLAGEDRVFDAAVRQLGALRATTTEEQLDMVYALAQGARPAGRRLGVVSLSGGVGIQICDAAERYGLCVPALDASLQERVTSRLPYASAANPVDVTAQALSDMELLSEALDAVVDSGQVDSLVVFLTTTPDAPQFAERLMCAIETGLRSRADVPVALVMLAEPATVQRYEQLGFLVFDDADRAVRALAGAAQTVASQATPEPLPRPRQEVGRLHRGALNEHQASRLLQAAGVPMARSVLIRSEQEAVRAAEELGYPVVLKICSSALLHKSDVGGVELGLADDAAVTDAYRRLAGEVASRLDPGDVDGVLVCEMVEGPGVEALVGVQVDPVLGPVVLVGLGGTLAELLDDVSMRLAPVDVTEAEQMISELRAAAALEGVRGQPRFDRRALARIIAGVSEFAWDHADDLVSLDLNPILVRTDGAIALDAVLETQPAKAPTVSSASPPAVSLAEPMHSSNVEKGRTADE